MALLNLELGFEHGGEHWQTPRRHLKCNVASADDHTHQGL